MIRQKPYYRKSPAVKELEALAFNAKCQRYPEIDPKLLLRHQYRDDTTNGLTRAILDYLKLNGWQAERISNTGRMIDSRKLFTDVTGKRRLIGSVKWIPGTGTNGTADISATIAGKSVKVECKIGADKQSKAQRDYQAAIERAGGLYVIARDFRGFVEWYDSIFCNGQ